MTIGFYEGQFAALSNFSSHQVEYEGVIYMTAEHAYQASKFEEGITREKIKSASSAFLAREYGQETKERRDIDKVKVMKEIMRAKLLQHEDVKDILLSTNNARIEKNHPDDFFWGTGKDGSGENVMGKIWMELREEVR